MKDFVALDAAIIARIAAGTATYTQLCIAVEADAMAHATSSPNGGAWRVVDRRLQALRKRGAIRFDGKTWHVNQPGTPGKTKEGEG